MSFNGQNTSCKICQFTLNCFVNVFCTEIIALNPKNVTTIPVRKLVLKYNKIGLIRFEFSFYIRIFLKINSFSDILRVYYTAE